MLLMFLSRGWEVGVMGVGGGGNKIVCGLLGNQCSTDVFFNDINDSQQESFKFEKWNLILYILV